MHDETESLPLSASLQLRGWQVAWAQLTGTRHRTTEDRVALRPVDQGRAEAQGLFLALADGVGGGARGDIAAEALGQHAIGLHDADHTRPAAIATWMKQAEGRVQAALRQATFAPGAATLAAAWLGGDGRGHLMRVGDARLYALDAQGIRQLTADQTYAQVGEAPPTGAGPDDCANMVGTGYMGEPDIQAIEVAPEACLLLCSDGLHKGLAGAQIHAALYGTEPIAGKGLEAAVRHLAEAARAAGSQDDISLLVARRLPPPDRPWWQRWLHIG